MCTTMYKLKPIITNFNIEFPNNNMYKVKNVLNDSEISEINYGPGVSVTKSSFMWDKRINEQIQAIIKVFKSISCRSFKNKKLILHDPNLILRLSKFYHCWLWEFIAFSYFYLNKFFCIQLFILNCFFFISRRNYRKWMHLRKDKRQYCDNWKNFKSKFN